MISVSDSTKASNFVMEHVKRSSMKVLMVISQFYPLIGGAERQAKLLAQTLIRKGINVSIVTGWWNFHTPHTEVVDGIRIVRNFSCWRMFGIKGLRTLGALIHMVSLSLYLLFHRHNYDILHVHQALYPAFVSVLIGKGILGKPVLVKAAGSGMSSDIKELRRFPFGTLQLKYLLKNIDCLVEVSRAVGNEFRKLDVTESRIVNIPNGVLIPNKGKRTRRQKMHVISVARLSKEKGIDVLLRAWENVSKHEGNLRLSIVGGGPLQSVLRRLSHSLGIDETVFFAGMINNIEEYLGHADLFVLPSRTEGLSNALLEAMSYGIPCIASRVGGNNEVFGTDTNNDIPFGSYRIMENGLLVNPDDVKGLSDAMLYLIRNNTERETLGENCRIYISKNYSMDSITEKYIALYKNLIQEKTNVTTNLPER